MPAMEPEIVRLDHARPDDDPSERFGLDVLMGLTSDPKYIPPKYFYDAAGSELFAKITDTEDYYPTRCEAEILQERRNEIASRLIGDRLNVIELGAGDGRKTKILMEALLSSDAHVRYVPIDISESAVQGIMKTFDGLFPGLDQQGIVAEYFEALRWIRDSSSGTNLVLFLGSNIGNFNVAQAEVFLKTLWNSLNAGDYVLVGFDLKKDIDTMLRAYNDSEGMTKRFNLNVLERMNRELGADFDTSQFEHFGTYNVKLGAMESFLVSKAHQFVHMSALNKRFSFKPYEAIHVEYSFKFLPEQINELATETGYRVIEKYLDSRGYFCDALLKVEKFRTPGQSP